MRFTIEGVSGTLLPTRYLVDQLADDARRLIPAQAGTMTPQRMSAWWRSVESRCGPATGLRAIFDLIAMPLAGTLGFTASNAVFSRDRCEVLLRTPRNTPVSLLVLLWSARPATLWRDAAAAARDIGASWVLVLAPPFLSVLDARGFATRRTLDLSLSHLGEPTTFAVFVALARASAFEVTGHAAPIDEVVRAAAGYQARVREDLQTGVSDALQALTSALDPSAEGEALTLIYRVLFLLFAESRQLVPADDPTYQNGYALSSLCREATRAQPRFGMWDAVAAVSRLSRAGTRGVYLNAAAFNGHLFARTSAPSLETRGRGRSRANARREEAMRQTLACLGSRPGRGGREEINYRDLGVEQLGAVYERLLDLEVGASARDRSNSTAARQEPRRAATAGHSLGRKRTGSFYTPLPLAEFVVRRTLAPLVAAATTDEILNLRVVDPAMGSGAFLIAACRYLAAAYARALIEEGRASPMDLGEDEHANIRRLIAERCLAGVDRNPVAVQLARLSLWLTTLARDKPLGFLDHRLRVGDSLIGASPGDLSRVGGRRPVQASPLPLFEADMFESSMRRFARPFREMLERHDDSVADVRFKEDIWRALASPASALQPWRTAASIWCARWFWPSEAGRGPSAQETHALLDAVLKRDRVLSEAHVASRLRVVADLAGRHRFFHWPLEFPDVFHGPDGATRAGGGFDAVLGNPPWEMWRRDGGTHHGAADRNDRDEDHTSLTRFIRDSGLYPSCDRGHLNLYQPFLERSLALTRRGGRMGLILPWGIATDDGAAALRDRLMSEAAVGTLVGLDNAAALFPIHRGMRFAVVVAEPGRPTTELRARFGVKTTDELDALPAQDDAIGSNAYPVRISRAQLAAIGGSTRRIPDVRDAHSLHLLEQLMSRFARLGENGGWACRFGRELNATEARSHFGGTGLPVVEGKHLAPFRVSRTTEFLIERSAAASLIPDGRFERPRLAYRDVAGVGNRLSLIAAIVPAGTVTTHTVFCLRSPHTPVQQLFLCALLNSYVLNFVARLLMGGHLTTGLVEGLPAPAWSPHDTRQRAIIGHARIVVRAGSDDAAARAHAGLQASVAKLYGLSRDDLRHVLASLPLVPAAQRAAVAAAFEEEPARAAPGPVR